MGAAFYSYGHKAPTAVSGAQLSVTETTNYLTLLPTAQLPLPFSLQLHTTTQQPRHNNHNSSPSPFINLRRQHPRPKAAVVFLPCLSASRLYPRGPLGSC